MHLELEASTGHGWQVCLEGAAASEDVAVQLYEARPGDPAVPQGKAFATISAQDAGISMHPRAAGVYGCRTLSSVLDALAHVLCKEQSLHL